MIGIAPVSQPRAPEVARPLKAPLGFLDGVRPAQPLGPGERAEALLSFLHRVTAVHAVALDTHADVAEHPKRGDVVGGVHRADPFLPGAHDRPLRGRRAVVEHRLAHHLHLDLTLDALDQAHEEVVGVVVRRRARVAGAVLVVVPLPDRQRVDHPQPSLRRHPRGLDRVRSRDVAPAGGDVDPVGPHAPAPGAAVEHRAEHGGRVEVGQAHPLDRPVGGDERPGVAVREEAIVGDRREGRVQAGRARAHRHGPGEAVARLRAAGPAHAHHSPTAVGGRSTPAGSSCSSSSFSRCAPSVTAAAPRSGSGTSAHAAASSSSVLRRPSASAARRRFSRSRRWARYSSSFPLGSSTTGPCPGQIRSIPHAGTAL